ncbi:copper homeostasis protein CutC [Cellulomonas fengjieae]|uniref:PF03932 family protein CutC n=1 Tax=Cellulomonas fengjieae TaxID=2819978 RepID=A0ABS3SHG2_9CELL|nr:copper homeostasis protein CutC [Cellulomonas fengjieae]MBO3085188.1 copper homeostasis protein CutC [Cellulomonas fengjieae]MBO3100929.1 copper homeostasis protein CutC [Cellulomonas fengjieae]QVI66240.1 copper homeostasis protein CutC [Cellulomonas fengjieae]
MGVTLLEIAVQDVAGAVTAAALGADRLELCAALAATGGLTPSGGLLDAVLAAVPPHVGVHVLVRPRAGSFVYSADELDVQARDVRAAVRAGAAGVVVGALSTVGAVDRDAVARLVDAADGREITFHRAIDTVPALQDALDQLVSLGIVRVLTSGGASRSIDGLDRLAATVAHGAGRLQVMAGGGVRPADIGALVDVGVDAVHLSASRHVAESGGPGGGSDGYTTTDPEVVAAAVAALGRRTAAT